MLKYNMNSQNIEPKTIIFDWDGTLVHTLDDWMISILTVLQHFGITNVSQKQIIDNIFAHEVGPLNLGIQKQDLAKFWQMSQKEFEANLDKVYFHEGAKEILRTLKNAGHQLALLTRTSKSTLEKAFQVLEFDRNHFEIIVTGNDVTHPKPHPEGVFTIIDYFRSEKMDTFIIGDSSHEIEAGKAAGIQTINFYPSHNEAFYDHFDLKVLQPDFTITKLEEMKNIIF